MKLDVQHIECTLCFFDRNLFVVPSIKQVCKKRETQFFALISNNVYVTNY